MQFLNQKKNISPSRIKRGMILEFGYTKKKDDTNDSYTVLVIESEKLHESSGESHLLGILVKQYSDEELYNLANDIKNNPELNVSGVGNLYRSFLKNRMFDVTQIVLEQQIDELQVYDNTRQFTSEEVTDALGEYFENEYTLERFPNLALTRDELAEMIRNSTTVVLENSDVEEMFESKNPQKTLYDMMAEQGRVADLNRILDGIDKKVNLPMPIVIKYPGGYYLMGGNSRLSALATIGYTMPVKLLTYTG
jgi:hypothetical protein